MDHITSVRIGFAFSVVALAMLTGNPIAGAILGVGREGRQNLSWWAAIVFAGVSRVFETGFTSGLFFFFAEADDLGWVVSFVRRRVCCS